MATGLPWFTKACVIAMSAFGFALNASAQTPVRNVLFIVVDDLNTRLGCYGAAGMKTPHLDALAARGVRFDRAYSQYPSCGPSRASVLTGLRPQTSRVLNNKTRFRDTVPDAITLPQWFRQHGHHVARVGKIFHQDNPTDIGTDGLDDPKSWDEVYNPRGRDKDEEDLLTVHTPELPLPDQMAYLAAEGDDHEQTDGKVADAAIKLLRRHKDRPFFIAAGFYRPHLPSIAPKRYFELYDLEKTTLPQLPEGYRERVPAAALASTPVWPNFGVSPLQARECIRAYEATISFVDAQIGRLIAALDELKLSERTVIVIWGDHGYHLGEHGLWRKNSLFEESCRAPLIIVAPGARRGGVVAHPVEFVDIYPTTVAAAGLPLPAKLVGLSLLPWLQDPTRPHDRAARSEVHFRDIPGRSVRTQRWRYTEWGVNGAAGRELYDHETDPREMNNLAAEPARAATCHDLRQLLH
ncbi:MAG: iduronate-2-sulfatase [Opitutus sp.]|nr:iduronate-2-sulfatase [Opitutus sp.]